MMEKMPVEVIAAAIVAGHGLNIRDVAAGEEAYHYSSGNFGPGYVSIKGTVGQQKLFKFLVRQQALRMAHREDFDFIAGLVTGGMAPTFQLREYLQKMQGREIPWVYIRETRKAGGTREHVTGILDIVTGELNPEIPEGSRGLVGEELTNYSNSVSNGARVLRASGFSCATGVSLLDYDHEVGRKARKKAKLELVSLLTLGDLLNAAEELDSFPQYLIDDYRWFLREPTAWMAHYGYEKKEHTR